MAKTPVFNTLEAACRYAEVIYPPKLDPAKKVERTPTESHPRSSNGFTACYPDGGILIGNWENDTTALYVKDGRPLSAAQQETARRRHQAAREQREQETAERQRETAFKARYFLPQCARITEDGHPYLKRKGVNPEGPMRVCSADFYREYFGRPLYGLTGCILVLPLMQGSKLWSLQLIDEAGNKQFLKDGKKGGTYWTNDPHLSEAKYIAVAEGVATALSFIQHSEKVRSAVAAIDAGNLKKVIPYLQQQNPGAVIFIAADNDAETAEKHGKNPGVEAAHEAAAAALIPSDRILIPSFSERQIKAFQSMTGSSKRPTDWNDYFRLIDKGIE